MIQLKTNIKCGGCIETVTPKLDALPNSKWQVDLNDPKKTLTVTGDATETEVKTALEAAGYHGEPI